MNIRLIVPVVLLLLSACKKEAEQQMPKLKTCNAVTPAEGLIYDATGTYMYSYNTSGGGTITIGQDWTIIFGHDDYKNFKIECWGGEMENGVPMYSAIHENLNGKHIKDRQGSRRTLIFPDGAKCTMVSDGEEGKLLEISIYDGDIVHHINPVCNTVELSISNREFADHFDQLQADGETGIFEFTADGLIWDNIYTEDTNGNKVEKRVKLGQIERDNPNHISDFFDDPRWDHT